ncbi:uncharacterized protein LOC134216093 [Armigeres subalbatus]|uniref:uncharacterized protein LOC134216093 n=1 Tax=Armigeres subalbatus TaxID=124917 RepID=UPI002ED49E50
MYLDMGLVSVRNNGRLAAVWLAATNKPLFRRHFERRQCESIDIDDMCNSILDCVTNQPFIMVAKLAYGAVYIYQQQVQYLYEKVSTAACLQTAAFQGLRKSSQKSSTKTGCRTTSLEERFDDFLEDPSVLPVDVITQLLAGDKNTSVVRADDITMQEIGNDTLQATVESTFNVQNSGFGEIDISEIVQDTDDRDLDDFTKVSDSTTCIRETVMDYPGIESTSMAIIDMPIASTSTMQLHEPNVNSSACVTADQQLVAMTLNPMNNPNYVFEMPIMSSQGHYLGQTSTRLSKNAKQRRLFINKKTTLDYVVMKRAIEDCSSNQRCKNPRHDIVALKQIRYPFDQARTILQQPIRGTRSSVLASLFTRNTRKRKYNACGEDFSLNGHIDHPKKNRTIAQPAIPEIVAPSPVMRSTDQNTSFSNITDHDQAVQITSPPEPHTCVMNELITENIDNSHLENRHTCHSTEPGREILESNLMNLLTELWDKNQGPISMKSLAGRFPSKLEAATCFSTILVLITKRKLHIIKNESNEIIEILPH